MKKLVLIILMSLIAQAYMINGQYANLVECNWVKLGYEHGYMGTYNLDGQYVSIWFGGTYCEY